MGLESCFHKRLKRGNLTTAKKLGKGTVGRPGDTGKGKGEALAKLHFLWVGAWKADSKITRLSDTRWGKEGQKERHCSCAEEEETGQDFNGKKNFY